MRGCRRKRLLSTKSIRSFDVTFIPFVNGSVESVVYTVMVVPEKDCTTPGLPLYGVPSAYRRV
jgi:hypothetical protein